MRSALGSLVKLTAAAADVARPTSGVVILAYHRVGGRTGVSVDLPLELFTDQIAWLTERHRVVTLDDAIAVLTGHRQWEGPLPVVVTFDDGTADFLTDALPVLEHHRCPATLYLVTQNVDERLAFDDGCAPLSWSGLAEAVATGLVDVGSHTHSHLLLDRVTHDRAAADLDRSIGLIGDRLGVEARHFAYPKALVACPTAEQEVRRRFVTAALSGTRPNRLGQLDLHRLHRSPIQVGDGMRWFERKASGGMGLESDLRELLNRWRYRNAIG